MGRNFHNRVHEIADIARAVASRRAELVVVYGRRGVGKSALLAEALRDRPHFFYQATTRAFPQQLEDLTAALAEFAPSAILPGTLPSFDALLEALLRLAQAKPDEPLVAVIDELPYLAQADPAVPTVIQRWWDDVRRRGVTNLKVFLLGSLVSWMEEQTLAEHGPLHNRRTGQIRLDPLDYAAAALFYPDYAPEERVDAFAIWGGLPSYLDEIDPQRDVWTNVREVILPPAGRLADEPSWLRFSDLRADALYSSILRAIAMSCHRPSEIARAVGRDRADEIKYHLDKLSDLRLVCRVVPIHEERAIRSRHALYRLTDNYVAFWYRYVDRLRHLLGTRRYDEALERIRADFDAYVSAQAFEEVCRSYVWRALAIGQLPAGLEFDAVGGWWTASTEAMDEIDVVATRDGRAVLVGECKWTRGPVSARDLAGLDAALRRATADLQPVAHPWRALFSRGGFADELQALARDPAERLLLVSPADLYDRPKSAATD